MDYISIHLQSCMECSESKSAEFWGVCKLIHQYLIDALRAEISWRLKALNRSADQDDYRKQLIVQLSTQDHEQIQSQLRSCLPVAFASDPEQLQLFDRLLGLLDELAILRKCENSGHRIPELCSRAAEILLKVEELRSESISFPPLSDDWEIVVPLSLEAGMWHCVVYQKNKHPRSKYQYLWYPMTLPEEVPEFNDGPLIRTESRIQCGRIYFRNGMLMRCYYPYVQLGFDSKKNDANSVWILQRMEQAQNGVCVGLDLLNSAELDSRRIPELVLEESVQENPYVTFTGQRDSEGNVGPLRNRYDPNYTDWCGSLHTINNAIRKLRENLDTPGCSLIYLYGSGGVGKTAAVQKLLEEYDVPQKHHVYEYIIFLSAKQHTWVPAVGKTMIDYDRSKGVQNFSDLPTLRRALRNIFCGGTAEEHTIPEQVSCDREQLFSGKSVLLVLDDFESVSNEAQMEIISYLRETFYAPPVKNEQQEQRRSSKRRQVIITSRDSSIESLRVDIMLPPLNQMESICLAKHFAKRFDWLADYDKAFGREGKNLSDLQMRKRELFYSLSFGKPLMILSLVRNYSKAEFPENVRTEKDLLNLLTKETYKYLGRNDLCQALAVMAAHLADEYGRNVIDRLRFIWDRWGQGGMLMDQNLELLKNYSVIQTDNQTGSYVFTSSELLESIKQSFKEDNSGKVNISSDLLRMAEGLRNNQHLPVEKCLMRSLQFQIQSMYRPMMQENFAVTYSDVAGFVDALIRLQAVGTERDWEFRKTIQMTADAVQSFRRNLAATQEKLRNLDQNDYPAELFWAITDEKPSIRVSRSFAQIEDGLHEKVRNVFARTSDPRDQFLQLWGVLLLTDLLEKRNYPISDNWVPLIREMLEHCLKYHEILSQQDLELLEKELLGACVRFHWSDLGMNRLLTAKRMAGRDSEEDIFFKNML